MEHLVYAVVIVLLATIAILLWGNEHRAAVRIAREKEEIEVEERRMFDFLHGLGEKIQEDNSPANMHRYVVDGVAAVIGAEAGVLYLLNGEKLQLVPVYQSSKTAPVIPAPPEITKINDEAEAEGFLRSFIRLSALNLGGTPIGHVMESESIVFIEDMAKDEAFAGCDPRFHSGVSFIAAPLVYGQKRVGVLAMTRHHQPAYSENDRDVFASVAEQSAFALGSAIIHSDAAEKRRLERELNQASEIQRILLPQKSPELHDYRIFAAYEPARIVSGDYYDYIKVDEERYGIAIGDVCGKGIAASLIMAMCRSTLRAGARNNLSPASVLHDVNASIFPDIRQDMFVSLLYLILERGSDEITMARAGHEPPAIYREATGEIETIEPPGMAAGIDQGPVFKRSVKDHRFTMSKGDIMLLYTDGIIESESRDADEYGVDRLYEMLKTYRDRSARDMVSTIMGDIAEFSVGMSQTDDITLIAVEKR